MKLSSFMAVLMVAGLAAGCHSPCTVQQDGGPELPPDARFKLHRIFGLDERTAWVGGGFGKGVSPLHTVMYVTHDAGKTWQQRGPTIANSEIFDMYFLNERTGWAVGAWTTESTGDPFVLRTLDGGMTWIRSEIPMEGRDSCLFDPMDIVFSSAREGVLRGVQTCGLPLDEVLWFVTGDGGKSWRFARGQGVESVGGKGKGFFLSVTKTRFMWRVDPIRELVSVSADDGMTWTQTAGQPTLGNHNNSIQRTAGSRR